MFGAKVRRQVPIGPFIVDFAVFAAKIVIELDGETHAEPERADADRIRDAWLAERDWRVLRFSNREIAENLDGVLQTIAAALQLPHPGPLPEGEGAATGP